jgi:transcriptional antiterminator RfaH
MNKDSKWYLVQCKPRESFRAEQHLINQNFICFHPTCIVKRKRSGIYQDIRVPLFPHYLFVLLSKNDNWATIRSTRGFSHMVYFNGIPASLDHAIVESLQKHCAKLNNNTSELLFNIGDRVLVADGCFSQIEAIVTATSGLERVTLLLNLFNREHQVEMPVSMLEAVA